MGGGVEGWMDWLMCRPCQISNNQINLYVIEIIKFYDLWSFMISVHTSPTGVSYQQLKLWVSSIVPTVWLFDNWPIHKCQFSSNQINLYVIDIIKFYDLWSFMISVHTSPTGVSHQQLKLWVSSIVPTVWLFDNWLIYNCQFWYSFDILTFDFLIKPPQPTTGLFYSNSEFTSKYVQQWIFWILSHKLQKGVKNIFPDALFLTSLLSYGQFSNFWYWWSVDKAVVYRMKGW